MGQPPASVGLTVRSSLCAASLFGSALFLIYFETTWSMVSIWSRSDTFAHGFLVLPISGWLAWMQRDYLRTIDPVPVVWVALLIIPSGMVWLLAWLVGVSVVQQLALIAMVIIGAWAVLGHQLARALTFPLFFLFFAVPIGEGLIPPMMEFTATSTVWMIQMTGIPVYREGLNFALPSGYWSVVEACSGVRYIIASITVGSLYAYLTYRSWPRRVVFVVISAIVPVFANTLRAFLTVILGHTSGMTLATGADHLIYGWVFFGLVIMLLFWLGSFFRQDEVHDPVVEAMPVAPRETVGSPLRKLLPALLTALFCATLAPFLACLSGSRFVPDSQVEIALPVAAGSWRNLEKPGWQWQPPTRVAGRVIAYYGLEGQVFQLTIQYPDGTKNGADVIGSSTMFAQQDSGSWVLGRDRVQVRVPGGELVLSEARVRSEDEELLAWSWYVLNDFSTSNPYMAKIVQARARLDKPGLEAYRIILATTMQSSRPETRALLQRFLDDHGRRLYEAMSPDSRGVR